MYLTLLADKHSFKQKKIEDITSESINYTVLHKKVLIIIEKYVHIPGWINDIIYHILTNSY